MNNYNTHTLANGMRVVHLPSTSPVIYCGLALKVGTRDEQPGQEGLAHFCEHLSFKGTQRRSAVQIINALEGVGGELNAFTNKEDTVFYCAILRDHFRKAVDVLTDIVFNSQYPQHEVEKEREVVCDEIESYEDSPAELIFDEIENVLFANHPLGHNILGTSEKVRSYNAEDARQFTSQHYRPDNAVFFASGDVNFQLLLRCLAKNVPQNRSGVTSCLPVATPHTDLESALGKRLVRERGTHQAHVVVGSLGYAADNPRRWALYLLNNILGGPGLNSRLNLSLRERNGLVYTVESSMVSYRDTGLWTIYFGCDPKDTNRCLRMVTHELERLAVKPLTDTQLRNAKRQLQGQLAIACDNREQFALDFAKNFLHTGKLRDLTDIGRHIEGLTAVDLQQTAQELFAANRLTTLVYN